MYQIKRVHYVVMPNALAPDPTNAVLAGNRGKIYATLQTSILTGNRRHLHVAVPRACVKEIKNPPFRWIFFNVVYHDRK